MKDTEIIENLRLKLSKDVGRHLYGILGNYEDLNSLMKTLKQVKTVDGENFPDALSLNVGIIESIPDEEFKHLVENEAKRPEPTSAHVSRAFENYIRTILKENNLIILKDLELLFSYGCELNILRTLSTDEKKIVLLLPGKKVGESIIMFYNLDVGDYSLPLNLIANDHLWQLNSK